MPTRKKRAASAPPLQLTVSSSREDEEAWLQSKLPTDLARGLIDTWRSKGEWFDGAMMLDSDEQLLRDTGCSITVARKILHLLTAERQQQAQNEDALMAPAGPAEGDSAEETRADVEEGDEAAAAQPETLRQQQQGRHGPVHGASRRKASLPPADAEAAAEDAEEEPADAAALEDHAMPLSAGRPTRRSSRRLSQRRQQQQQRQQQQIDADEEEDEQEEDGGSLPTRPARRGRWQQQKACSEDEQGEQEEGAIASPLEAEQAEEVETADGVEAPEPPGRRRGRQSRISAIHTRVLQRPAQLHAAEQHPQLPRQQQAQDQPNEQPEDAQERLLPAELTGLPVLEDLGPEARNQQWRYDWEERCWRGLEELFLHFFSLEQLRKVVEHLAEDWAEEAEYCVKECRKEKGSLNKQARAGDR